MAEKLAIYGGPKAKTTPNYPMYPGGLEIGEAEKKEVMEVLDNKYLFRYYGPEGVESKVRKFEEHFKAKMGAKHCLATSSCTGALLSALTACGIGPGDECIVTGYTFFASCAAIVGAKAIPVIAEVDETLTIDPADIEKKITPATKGICAASRAIWMPSWPSRRSMICASSRTVPRPAARRIRASSSAPSATVAASRSSITRPSPPVRAARF